MLHVEHFWVVKSVRPNENHSHLAPCGLVDFNYQEKLNDNHYHWANGSDNFHLHFEADKLRLVSQFFIHAIFAPCMLGSFSTALS